VWVIIDTLGHIKDEKAIDSLVAYLQADDPDIVLKAVNALGAIGAESAVDPLITVLKDPDSPGRHAAVEALSGMGASPTPAIIAALPDTDAETRALMAKVLIGIGTPAIDPLAVELGSTDATVRATAREVLTAMGAECVDAVGDVLRAEGPIARDSAAVVLVEIGNGAAVAKLVDSLSIWRSAKTAAAALGTVGWTPETTEERILYLIGMGRGAELMADWDTTRYFLVKKLQSGSDPENIYGINAFIAIGKNETIPQLLEFIDKRGRPDVADIYRHSENDELVTAASKWLGRNKRAKMSEEAVELEPWTVWGSMGK
jgi:HEAT repeat protein